MQLNLSYATGVAPSQTGVSLIARILGNLGTPITRATIASISYVLTDLTNGLTSGSGTFTVATVVFDNLVQNDPRWTADSPQVPGKDGRTGYNFLATIPAADFSATQLTGAPAPPWQPPLPRKWQVDVHFTPVSGEPFVVPFLITEVQTFG